MAKYLRLRKGKYYARIQWRDDNGHKKEKQVPLRTHLKTEAYPRLAEVMEKADDFKEGLDWDFPWLKEGSKVALKERSIGEALQEYYSVRNVEGVRNTTINRIEVAMKSLFTMMSPRTRLVSLDEGVLDRYKRHCKESLNHKPNTININLSKIRAFLNWCHRKEYIKHLPYIDMVRVERSEVNYLSDDMMLKIMESYGIEDHYKRAFLFYFDTGCRLFEPFNGYIKGNTLVIPPSEAKTHRKRTVHLTEITLAILHEMCERVDNCIGKKRFAVKNYSRVFKKACRTVGISDKYHFHNLRDTYAVRRWAVTGDIHLVSKEIGHKSVMTTERYADFDLESLLLDFKSLEKWIAPRLEKPTIDGFFLNALNTAIIPSEDTNLEDTIAVCSS